ncbi:MAG: GAP family protein, partial [Gaiellaceae bacterium]
MLALVAFVVSVGLADSVNPSTVGPALYLATRRNAQRDLVGFIAGVFAVSAVGGIALTLGPGRAVLAALPRIDRRAEHIVEFGAGLALIIFALVLWLQRERVARHLQRERQRRGRSPLLLGAAIMTVELPTALPYFAVVAAIAHSRRGAVTEIALL